MTYRIGYLVGSLSSTSINRTVARALVGLAPPELELVEIGIRDLPLYSPDYDDDYPPQGRATKEAVKEATRLYCHLKRRAPALTVMDLGGGLGVDYDGTSSASDWSLNYTLEGYCRDVVYGVKVVCDQERVDPPILLTESGRAVLAYHAVTVVTPLKIIGRTAAAAWASSAMPRLGLKPMKTTTPLPFGIIERSATVRVRSQTASTARR